MKADGPFSQYVPYWMQDLARVLSWVLTLLIALYLLLD